MKMVIAFAFTSLLIGCVDVSQDEEDADLSDTEQASICGAANDAQQVNSYDGTLGPSITFVQSNKGSKGAMESDAVAGSSTKYCSGTLISADLFLTAGHCVDSTSLTDYVSFNFEYAAGSTTLLTETHAPITEIVEDA